MLRRGVANKRRFLVHDALLGDWLTVTRPRGCVLVYRVRDWIDTGGAPRTSILLLRQRTVRFPVCTVDVLLEEQLMSVRHTLHCRCTVRGAANDPLSQRGNRYAYVWLWLCHDAAV